MDRYEYKVVPAPEKGLKAKGIKTPGDRFAHAVETAMNELGSEGWEYWRAECLPSTERAGLTSSKITERHLLVFRRALPEIPQEDPVIPPRRIVQETPVEPEPEIAEPEPERPRMPVFTRRLEIAREQREEALGTGEAEPQIGPVEDDQGT